MELSRRNFLKFSAGALGAAGILGFDASPAMARVPAMKISQARVTKGICPYCSVSCGVLVYTLTDGSLNVKAKTVHVEGNPDDPVNRGTLCPKGATLKDFLNAPNRLTKPLYRAPGATEWKEVTWDWTIDKMAALVKDTRDRTFVEKDDNGRTVNRCGHIASVIGCPVSNEEGYLGIKIARALGLIALETQARV